MTKSKNTEATENEPELLPKRRNRYTVVSNLTFNTLQIEYRTRTGDLDYLVLTGQQSVEVKRFKSTETTQNLVDANLISLVDIMR